MFLLMCTKVPTNYSVNPGAASQYRPTSGIPFYFQKWQHSPHFLFPFPPGLLPSPPPSLTSLCSDSEWSPWSSLEVRESLLYRKRQTLPVCVCVCVLMVEPCSTNQKPLMHKEDTLLHPHTSSPSYILHGLGLWKGGPAASELTGVNLDITDTQ